MRDRSSTRTPASGGASLGLGRHTSAIAPRLQYDGGMLVVPVGIEGGGLRRVPVVSILVAAACIAGFAATWVRARAELELADAAAHDVIAHWKRHAYLELPAS